MLRVAVLPDLVFHTSASSAPTGGLSERPDRDLVSILLSVSRYARRRAAVNGGQPRAVNAQ
jgi:hypothetical protein